MDKLYGNEYKYSIAVGRAATNKYRRRGPRAEAELRKMLDELGMTDVDATSAMSGFTTDRDGHIKLSDWEKGLDDRTRAAIEAKLTAEGA